MKQGAQVLLIDDNPVIRQLLLESLAAESDVSSFSGAREALLKAQTEEPDLIISDFRMPGLSGLELLAQLRVSHPHVAVIMMASRADIHGPLAGAAPLVEEFIEKPFFVTETMLRVRRVLERIAVSKAMSEGANSTSVRGTLAQMSVIDLLQTLDMGRKSCRLRLSYAAQECHMLFHDGQLVHATMGEIIGEEVVYKVAGWPEGSFQIDFERVECIRTIRHSTQAVLMEALRLFDEAQRDAAEELPAKPVSREPFASHELAAGD